MSSKRGLVAGAALIGAAVLSAAVPAMAGDGALVVAQESWRTPPPLPGDRNVRRGGQVRDPLAPPPIAVPDPLGDRDRAIKRLFEDPGRRLGLPAQPNLNPPPGEAAAPAGEPTLPVEALRLDRNRDGAISREEYFRGRSRTVPAGPAGDARQRQLQERLDSRFRQADSDRNGAVSPQELDQYGSPRF